MTPEWTEKERLALEWADALGGRPAQQGYETVLANSLRAAKAENEARVLLIRSLTKDRKDFAEQVEALELDLKSTRQVFNRMAHTLQENVSKYDDGKMLGMPLEQAASALMSQFKAEADALRRERDASRRQSGCSFCEDHHFNVTVCAKCAFRSTESHRQALLVAELRAQLAAARAAIYLCESDGGCRAFKSPLDSTITKVCASSVHLLRDGVWVCGEHTGGQIDLRRD